jgi:superfamily II DNA/RNA helicase
MKDRNVLNLTDLQTIVLDEADQMLNMGFSDDIERIYEILLDQNQKKVQSLLFSATIPGWLHNIADRYLSKNK